MQIYKAVDDSFLTGPISLTGATGDGSSSPFEKTINLQFGEYKVGSGWMTQWHRQAMLGA